MRTDGAIQAQWLIDPDASGLQNCRTTRPGGMVSRRNWLYYQTSGSSLCIDKIPAGGGTPVRVRCGANVPLPSPDGTTLYPGFVPEPEQNLQGQPGERSCRDRRQVLRDPRCFWPTGHALSRDGGWSAVPLKDGATTNIWAIPRAAVRFVSSRISGDARS